MAMKRCRNCKSYGKNLISCAIHRQACGTAISCIRYTFNKIEPVMIKEPLPSGCTKKGRMLFTLTNTVVPKAGLQNMTEKFVLS